MENTMTKQEQVNLRNKLTLTTAAELATRYTDDGVQLLLFEFQIVIELIVQLYAREGVTLISPKGVKLNALPIFVVNKDGKKVLRGVRIWDEEGQRNWEVDEKGVLRPQRRGLPLYTNRRALLVALQGWKLIVDPSTPPTNHPGLVWPTADRAEQPGALRP